ncbi:MAG: BglII/BstYI family type II restriction endonuclease [Anaerolineaceae bacterium]
MNTEYYSHRYADIILNSDYELKREIDDVIKSIKYDQICERFEEVNYEKQRLGNRSSKGKQSVINCMFREEFLKYNWELEKNVFNDAQNDLIIDFKKRDVGLDVAFNHRSFIGGDLLRFQAASEVRNLIKVGVYICPTKAFAKIVSPSDGAAMVSFERTKWYLQTLYPVITVPILLIGLTN